MARRKTWQSQPTRKDLTAQQLHAIFDRVKALKPAVTLAEVN